MLLLVRNVSVATDSKMKKIKTNSNLMVCNIDSLHYSVSTSNTELHRLLLDCNETEQEIIIRTAKELKATLVSLGI